MPQITPITVQGIIQSDQQCFRSLYDAYYSYLCGVAVTYVRDFEKARELVNDVFLRVWERRDQLKYPPLPYLIAGVKNACLNYLRDHSKLAEVTLMESLPDVEPYEDREVEELVSRITDLSTQLPRRCGEIFQLHFFEGMDTADIAEKLGIAPSTIRVQLKIALEKIREKINIRL